MSVKSEERQKAQLAILESGDEVEAGSIADLPCGLELLKAVGEDSPYVSRSFKAGLTAEVFKIEIDGKSYTLKKKREKILVHNADGQTSFLNEVQRRRDFELLRKSDSAAYSGIVPTIYASLRHGIILSPWIEGEHIHRFTDKIFDQIFNTMISMELGGIFEYDPTGGNLLLSDDGSVLMYDFGYAYRFDPRSEINPDGCEVPVFHCAERFETRCFMQHLMDVREYVGDAAALSLYRLEKESALKAYERKLCWLEQNGGTGEILSFVRVYISLWDRALSAPAELEKTLALESFRSWVLDMHDDVGGKSCTPDTIRKAEKVIAILAADYEFLKQHCGFFWGDEKLSRDELLKKYASLKDDALRYQTGEHGSFDDWHSRRREAVISAYR